MHRGHNRQGRGGNRHFKQESSNNRNNYQQSKRPRNLHHDHREAKRPRRDGRSNGGPGRQFRPKSEPHHQYYNNNTNGRVKSEPNYHHTAQRTIAPKTEPKLEDELLVLPLPEIDFKAREIDVLQDNRETPYEGCVYIGDLPEGVTKDALARFIVHQYIFVQGYSPKIVACTIREERGDAFVEFENIRDAAHATNVLHRQDFRGDNLRQENNLRVTGSDEETYWRDFRSEASAKLQSKKEEDEENAKQQKAKAEVITLDAGGGGEDELSSRELEYFQKQIKVSNCIYIFDLPERFGANDLSHFIEKECTKRLPNITAKITACHVRSRDKDACVEFESHMSQIFTILDRPIGGKYYFQKKKWNQDQQALSENFIKYYREKEERRRQKKKANNDQQEKQQSASKDADTPGISNQSSANDSALQKELLRMKEKMKLLKQERNDYRKEFVKVTNQHTLLKNDHQKLIEEKEELAQKLDRVEEEADTIQFNFKEAQKSNAEQLKVIEDLKEENKDLKAELKTTQQAHEESEVAHSNLQGRFTELESKSLEIKRNLHQVQQDLKNEREARVQTEHTLINTRIQSSSERDQRLVRVKQEGTNIAQELANYKRENKMLKKIVRLFHGIDTGEAPRKAVMKGPPKIKMEAVNTEHVEKVIEAGKGESRER